MLLRCRQHLFAWNKHQLVQLTLSMKAIYFPHQHWLFFYGPDAIFSQALMSETQLPSVTPLVPKPASLSILSRSGSSTSFFPEWWTSSQSLQEPLTNSAPGKIWVIIWLNRQGWRASHVAVVVKNPPPSAGGVRDSGLISMSGRLPGGGHGNPLQYSCLENPMDRGAWKAKSSTWLKRFSTHACMHAQRVGGSQIFLSGCPKWSWIQLRMCYPGYWQFPYCDLILLGNMIVEIYLLVKFPVILNEDEFFPPRWITNTHPYKLWVVSTASSIREKAIWQTHLR